MRQKTVATLFLIVALFFASTFLSRQEVIPFDSNKIYAIESRCEELLSNNSYILSAYGQRFYLRNEDSVRQYRVGDSLSFQAKIYSTHPKGNQKNSNYNLYLLQQGIHYKAFPYSPIKQSGHSDDIYSVFQQLRSYGIDKLERHLTDSTNSAVLKALCLGYKHDLSSDTKRLFTTTGTIHLLAVSGLHTGIIYILILFLCRVLHIPKRFRYLFSLPLLWSYACLTGLSPSVVRAALILTFIDFAGVFQRDYTPLNAIGAAAFFTLLFYPYTLFSLSFQMSYAAYTGIILFLALLPEQHRKKSFLYSYLLIPIGITLSAQIATAPISVFNFHTFPVTGFVANLVTVPFATLILYCGAIFLLLPDVLCRYCSLTINCLCDGFIWTLGKLGAISINLTHLYPTVWLLLFVCILFTLIYLYLQKRSRFSLIGVNIILCTILFYTCTLYYVKHHKSELIVFHLYKESIILMNHNGYYCCIPNRDEPPHAIVTEYIQRNKLQKLPSYTSFVSPSLSRFDNLIVTEKDSIVIIDRKDALIPRGGILIITNNITPEKLPTLNINRPSLIIMDNSNALYCLRAWELFAGKMYINLSKTRENGDITIHIK